MPTILETIVKRIGDIQKTVDGVAAVSSLIPLGDGVSLPLFVNLLNPARYQQNGDDADLITRTVNMTLLIAEAKAGLMLTAQSRGIVFADLVHDAFLNRRQLQLDDAGMVHLARLLSDTGVGSIDFDSKSYIGIKFELQVIYYKKATET